MNPSTLIPVPVEELTSTDEKTLYKARAEVGLGQYIYVRFLGKTIKGGASANLITHHDRFELTLIENSTRETLSFFSVARIPEVESPDETCNL